MSRFFIGPGSFIERTSHLFPTSFRGLNSWSQVDIIVLSLGGSYGSRGRNLEDVVKGVVPKKTSEVTVEDGW